MLEKESDFLQVLDAIKNCDVDLFKLYLKLKNGYFTSLLEDDVNVLLELIENIINEFNEIKKEFCDKVADEHSWKPLIEENISSNKDNSEDYNNN